MGAPTIDPTQRRSADVPAAESFEAGQRIWVFQAGAWRPGVVLHSSMRAVTVRYRPAEGRGTGVDTVTGHQLAPRDDTDPYVDAPASDLPLAPQR